MRNNHRDGLTKKLEKWQQELDYKDTEGKENQFTTLLLLTKELLEMVNLLRN